MPDRLPLRVNPYKMAASERTLKGVLTTSQMKRLKDMLVEDELEIACEFAFSKQGGDHILEGQFDTSLEVVCQRCLQPMTYPLERSFELVLVETDEQAARLQDKYETCMVSEEELMDLSTVIEDEIILSLPSHPRHRENCLEGLDYIQTIEENVAQDDNPFAILEKLKS